MSPISELWIIISSVSGSFNDDDRLSFLGLAYVGEQCSSNSQVQWCGLCNTNSQQSISEDKPLRATTATTAAHELGHKYVNKPHRRKLIRITLFIISQIDFA